MYDLSTKKILHKIRVFPQCFKIVGIQVQTDNVIVNSEKAVKALDGNTYEVKFDFSNQSHDKIVHCSVQDSNLYVVNAHNFLEIWNLEDMTLIQRRFCEEECILYSGDFNLKSKMVVGGTVFRSVIVWKVDEQPSSEPAKILYKLEGHAGVIFDVQFLKDDLVASVSDDRTLRVWRLNLQHQGEYQQIMECYGHRSRIWKVRDLGVDNMLVTASEDATCKIWPNFDQLTDKVVSKPQETLKGHSGKNVRAVATYEGIIATGGDDGSIKVWNAIGILSQKDSSQASDTIISKQRVPYPGISKKDNLYSNDAVFEKVKEQIEGDSLIPKKRQRVATQSNQDHSNQIRCIEITELIKSDVPQYPLAVLGTNKGTISVIEIFSKSNDLTMKELYQDPKMAAIQDMSLSQKRLTLNNAHVTIGAVAIGDGEILVFKLIAQLKEDKLTYSFEEIAMYCDCDIKILNVFLVDEQQVSQDLIQFSVISANGRAELLKRTLTLSSTKLESDLSQPNQTFKVAIKTQFISLLFVPNLHVMIGGDTKGNLFMFDYTATESEVMNYQQLKAHKNERVISLQYDEERYFVYSTSKDNYINVYNFDSQNMIQKIQSIKEEDLNIIYNIHLMGQKMVLLGFYGNFAYVWNKQENMQIFSIDTKGGNRPIRLRVQIGTHIPESQYGKKFILAYSFGDCIVICNNWSYDSSLMDSTDENQYTLTEPLHGREILSACSFSINENKTVILTGGEDSFLKVNEYDLTQRTLRTLQTFSNHVASIRTITKVKTDETQDTKTYIVLTAGSRMQANVFKAEINKSQDTFNMGHLCSFMRSSEQDEEQDFRIMASTIVHYQQQTLCIFGTSSGEVTIFEVNYKKRRLEDVCKFDLSSPILSLQRVKLSIDQFVLVDGLANGDIYLIKVQFREATEPQIDIHAKLDSVHDFGVNTLDAKYLPTTQTLMIASGGDDQQISIITMQPNQDNQFQVTHNHKQYGHSSCIKGLVMWKSNQEQVRIASSSYDQRYKEWKVNFDEGKLSLIEQKVTRHCMSDMNGISKVKLQNKMNQVLLVGQGLSIFESSQ